MEDPRVSPITTKRLAGGWRTYNQPPLDPEEVLARLDAIYKERLESVINPPVAEDCRYWLMSDEDRDQLEAIQSQLVEPLRSRLQAMIDRLERDPS